MTKESNKNYFMISYWKPLCWFAFIIWLLIFGQIFISDFSGELIQKISPTLDWLKQVRFFIFILLIGVSCMIFKTSRTLFVFLFVLAYPLILILFLLPKTIFWSVPKKLQNSKNGFSLYFFYNQIFNFSINLKYNLVKIGLFVISVALLFNTTDSQTLQILSIVFLMLLALHFINRFRIAVNSEKLVSQDIPQLKENRLLGTMGKLDLTKTKDKESAIFQAKQQRIILFKTLSFVREQAATIKRDKNYYLIILYRILGSISLTLCLLTFTNYTTFLSNTNSFLVSEAISLFDTFIYTFHTLHTGDVEFMIPKSDLARFLKILAPICTGFIGLFFFSVFSQIHSDKYREKLDAVIASTEEMISNVEAKFTEDFSMSITDCYLEVKNKKNSLIFLFMRYFLGMSESEIFEIE